MPLMQRKGDRGLIAAKCQWTWPVAATTFAHSREQGRLMDYQSIFAEAIAALHAENRYRVFADLERIAGQFPKALWRSEAGSPRDRRRGAPTTISAWARTRP